MTSEWLTCPKCGETWPEKDSRYCPECGGKGDSDGTDD